MTNNSSPNSPPPIWYKQFWPWFLIFFPATAVIAGIATIILELKQKALKLNLSAKVNWNKLTQAITLKLTGNISKAPSRLALHLAHATRANHDQTITLYLAPDKKSYTGKIKKVKSGNWIIILEPEEKNWRLNGRVTLPKQSQWQLDSK